MSEERNKHQITRKDARGCFVESLNDVFAIGKTHFAFASCIIRPFKARRTASDEQCPHLYQCGRIP